MNAIKKLLCYFCFGLLIHTFGYGQTNDISTLAVDISVEREILQDEVQRYKITAQNNDFV